MLLTLSLAETVRLDSAVQCPSRKRDLLFMPMCFHKVIYVFTKSITERMSASYEPHKIVAFGVDGKQQPLELAEVDILTVVDSSFVYPSFKSVKEKEIKEISSRLIFHYKCDSSNCEFPITALKESVDLKSTGTKETAEVIVNAIDAHQQLFTARQCGGYIFQAAGKSLILLQNDSVAPSDDTRFGFVDLTETRRRLIHQYEMSKMRKTQSERFKIEQKAALFTSTPLLLTVGSGIGGGCIVLAALKFLKKI